MSLPKVYCEFYKLLSKFTKLLSFATLKPPYLHDTAAGFHGTRVS